MKEQLHVSDNINETILLKYRLTTTTVT